MTAFADLLDAALAGTLRQDPPTVVSPLSGQSRETRLLHGASLAGLRHLAGRTFTSARDGMPLEPAPPETLAQVPAAAARRLANVLDRRPELLREYLTLVASHHLRVPHELLPALLDHAAARLLAEDDLSDLLTATGGARLPWLAAQRATWSFAAHFDAEQQFLSGSLDARVRALRAIRRHDPDHGRRLLVDTWSSEGSEARRRLLSTLALGLSSADQPLLEQALRGRDQARPVALSLLRRLPDSDFSERWAARARNLLTPGDRSIHVQPIEEAPAAWIADGLSLRPPKNTGETAWLVQQVLGFTPPSTWPTELLSTSQQSDWAQPILIGLTDAALAYADVAWSEALVLAWASSSDSTGRVLTHVQHLFAQLESDRAEALFSRLLDSHPVGVVSFFRERVAPWSAVFSRAIVQRLPSLLKIWQHGASSFLRDAQLRLDPAVLPELDRLLELDEVPRWLELNVRQVVAMLDYRLTMQRELEAP